MGLTPATLVFHGKAATVHTILLGVVIPWLLFALQEHPGCLHTRPSPDLHPRRLHRAPPGILLQCHLRSPAHPVRPHLRYGAPRNGARAVDRLRCQPVLRHDQRRLPGWLRTRLIVLITHAVVVIALSNARHGYRISQWELAAAERDVLTGLLNRAGLFRWYAQPGTDPGPARSWFSS